MAPYSLMNRRSRGPRSARASSCTDLVAQIQRNSGYDTPVSLLEHLDLAGFGLDRTARPSPRSSSSSSSSEFAPPRKPRRPLHKRAFSSPLPGLFGFKKSNKKHSISLGALFRRQPTACPDDEDGDMPAPRPGSQGHAANRDVATGCCITCGSLMRWPKELNHFRCIICATINDLAPLGAHTASQQQGDGGLFGRRPISSTSQRPQPRTVQPISLEHSKRLVEGCLRTSLTRRLCKRPRPETENKPIPQSETSQDNHPAIYEACSKAVPCNAKPEAHPEPTKCDLTRVFKPVEDYLAECFRSFDKVNSSFPSPYPRVSLKTGSEPTPQRPLPPRESQGPRSLSREKPLPDPPVCEPDPKLLLLGDVAENGTWWAGGQSHVSSTQAPNTTGRNDEASPPFVNRKNPEVNWVDLSEWYSVVTDAAQGWLSIHDELSQHPDYINPSQLDLQIIEQDLLQSQTRLRRTLLKATENLLKRPGGKICEAQELRLFLIILENPLLHTETPGFKGFVQPHNDTSLVRTPSHQPAVAGSGPMSGHHSGIVKRIVGLMSNLTDELHHQLIAWFSRYPAARFIKTKELIFGFLTYRLLRQDHKRQGPEVDITAGIIPQLQPGRSSAALHDEIGLSRTSRKTKGEKQTNAYSEDWQVKAASRVLSLLFEANNPYPSRRGDDPLSELNGAHINAGQSGTLSKGLFLPMSDFYSSLVDFIDLVADFGEWEARRGRFSFCQHPFLMSIWAKTQIFEHDIQRQMRDMARDAFFDSIMHRRTINQFLVLDVRRECLVEDSLKSVSEVIGSGSADVKKALRIKFRSEEGIDGGGPRKEWFLLLVREVFNPEHGLFIYDEDSQYCYFNPFAFETSNQFFLVGVVMGLAIYNSTILDVALPPFMFRKLLASAPAYCTAGSNAHARQPMRYTVDELAEYRPRLAHGLRQLLEYDGDVEETFCVNFVIDMDKYGTTVQVPLCDRGEQRPVTNQNRREYVDLYVRYLLDTSVARQFDPFKRGFYTVCSGNAFTLFRPEEVELLVRGSDEPLDILSLRDTAEYDNWGSARPDGIEPVVGWFWEMFGAASPQDQRRLLSFITGSDRLPATRASMTPIRISCLGDDCGRYPIARTCFNLLSLWKYDSKQKLETMLWRAVYESEGFGLK